MCIVAKMCIGAKVCSSKKSIFFKVPKNQIFLKNKNLTGVRIPFLGDLPILNAFL